MKITRGIGFGHEECGEVLGRVDEDFNGKDLQLGSVPIGVD